jgi:hypothetical protein
MDIRQKIEAGEYETKLPWPSEEDGREIRQAKRKACREDMSRLREVFKADLFLEYGLDQHPMREKVWSKAWDDGHASGYSEVVSHFEDLLPLLESPLKGHPGLPTLIADLEISAHDASDGLDAHVTEAYKLLLEILRVKHF